MVQLSPAFAGGHGLPAVEERVSPLDGRVSSEALAKEDWSFGEVPPKPKVPRAPVRGAPKHF